jgi:mannosyl-oligosaccharide alpha-1,2-mannosidase
LPLYVSVQTGSFASNHVSLGAMGDSAFEYLIKTWVLRGRKEEWLKEMYDKATDGIMKHMVKTSAGDHRMYVAEYKGGSPIHKMDHLACFVGGMFILGAPYATDPEEHIKVAKGVGETCFQMYATQKSGLSPENVEFGGGSMHAGSVYNIQRPEAVEAWFYLWRATKDPIWREHGWTMLQNFNKCCKIESGGYVGVRDVRQATPPLDDTQQTFWLAETLKYLYLLFSDDETIPLDKYVFNTEAHPLKIWADDAKN